MRTAYFVLSLMLIGDSHWQASLNAQTSPDDRRRANGYEEFAYRFDGKSWVPIWMQCDGYKEVVLISYPDSAKRMRYETYKKNSPSQRTVTDIDGIGETGAGLEEEGEWIRARHIATNLNQCACRWFLRTRFAGITERRSVYVTVSESGELEYRSFNFSEAHRSASEVEAVDAYGLGNPSVLLQGGSEKLDRAAGMETFTFVKEEYTYVVEVEFPDRSPSAHIIVKKNNVEIQRERCQSFAYAWKAPIPHLAAGQPVDVKELQMLDATTGWAVGRGEGNPNDHILRTTDSGLTWRDLSPPEPPASDSSKSKSAIAFFLNANDAWVTYYEDDNWELEAFCWSTHDAGQTWRLGNQLPFGKAEYYRPSDLQFVDSQTGWLTAVVGNAAGHAYMEAFATTDGGVNWDRLNNVPMGSYGAAMFFTNAQIGWATTYTPQADKESEFYKTIDGGRTWQHQDLPPPTDAPDLFTKDIRHGIRVHRFFPAQTGLLIFYCNDAGNYNTDSEKHWLYLTVDGGKTWRSRSLPTRYPQIEFISSTSGWLLGGNDRDTSAGTELYHTQDRGQNWKLVKMLGWLSGKLHFINEQEGWAIAETGNAMALVKTTDGGKTWQELKPHIAP